MQYSDLKFHIRFTRQKNITILINFEFYFNCLTLSEQVYLIASMETNIFFCILSRFIHYYHVEVINNCMENENKIIFTSKILHFQSNKLINIKY